MPEHREWQDQDIGELASVDALLTTEEMQLFSWVAQHHYTGAGEIVDAGSFIGGSAAAFAHGLARNPRVTDRSGRIHSFDTFSFRPFFNKEIPALDGMRGGESFLGVFHEQVRRFDTSVTVHPGDLTRRTWRGGPIELLMVDCAKTAALNDHVLRQFFPALVPGMSWLLHQDFASRSRLHWIHASMYLLRDHFEFVGGVEEGGTVFFRCQREVTADDVERVIAQQHDADVVALADEAARHMAPHGRRYARVIRRTARRFVDNP
jgi:hypothetical protein